jgi:hypothetical protein
MVIPSGEGLAVSNALRLQVHDFTDWTKWRLTEENGTFLAAARDGGLR